MFPCLCRDETFLNLFISMVARHTRISEVNMYTTNIEDLRITHAPSDQWHNQRAQKMSKDINTLGHYANVIYGTWVACELWPNGSELTWELEVWIMSVADVAPYGHQEESAPHHDVKVVRSARVGCSVRFTTRFLQWEKCVMRNGDVASKQTQILEINK